MNGWIGGQIGGWMDGWTDRWMDGLVSFVGSTIQTIATFSHSDQRLRLMMLVGISLWLINDLLIGSPMAALMELTFLCSNLVGYYRYYGLTLKSQTESG